MRLLSLGLVPYDEAWDLQHQIVAARKQGLLDDVLILLEHPPVITLGRQGHVSNIVASPETLVAQGIIVRQVERGGDVTYHGPGQLVGYPIMDLKQHRKDVRWYVHSLEEVLIRTLADFGIRGYRVEGLIGVWVDAPAGLGDMAKVAAIGARIERWVTYHGFALNVDPEMSHFNFIIPCGIHGKAVVSMRQLLGRTITVDEVRPVLVHHFGEVFHVTLRPTALDELTQEMGVLAIG